MSEQPKGLSRWSERKAAARRGEVLPEPAEAPPVPDEEREVAVAPEQSVPADEEMPVLPSVDDLTAESDYTVFLGDKVPEALRRAALRKLWTSDPVLANLDGLNDYDEDYNLTTTVIGAVQSAWQAGRGYAEEAEKKLEQVEEALGPAENSQAERQPQSEQEDESQSASETTLLSQDGDGLGESDATGVNSTDASQRIADASVDVSTEVPPEQHGK